MDRLERALARVEIASDRRLSRLENVMVDLQSTMGSLERTVGSLQGTVDKLTVRVTAFIESQKEVNDAITTALKTFDRRTTTSIAESTILTRLWIAWRAPWIVFSVPERTGTTDDKRHSAISLQLPVPSAEC